MGLLFRTKSDSEQRAIADERAARVRAAQARLAARVAKDEARVAKDARKLAVLTAKAVERAEHRHAQPHADPSHHVGPCDVACRQGRTEHRHKERRA